MEKKAVSHVEMMISFAIFIMFILLLFVFFNPFRRGIVVSESLLDIVEFAIRRNVTINFTSTTLSLNQSTYDTMISGPSGHVTCFIISEGVTDKKLIVKNETGDRINAKTTGPLGALKLYIELSGRFYYIYYSDAVEMGGYNNPGGQCANLMPGGFNYTYGVTKIKGIATLGSLALLNKTYWEDYEALKDQFKFPQSKDFGFIVRNESKGILFDSARKTLKSFDVLARQVPLEIIDETNGDFIYGELQILVW